MMNKKEFLEQLNASLRKLRKAERRQNLEYYEEMLSDMIEHGMTEEEAVEKAGSPKDAAAEILSSADPAQLRHPDIPGRILLISTVLLILLQLIPLLYMGALTNGIAVIGGADGPTSIYVAAKTGFFPSPLLILTILLSCITVLHFFLRYRRNKKK